MTFSGRTGVGLCTVHDLRRSRIMNWAKALPIHVVQQLAGHSDIRTTQQSCLSSQAEDGAKAQAVKKRLLRKALEKDLTDPRLPHLCRGRSSSGRGVFRSRT